MRYMMVGILAAALGLMPAHNSNARTTHSAAHATTSQDPCGGYYVDMENDMTMISALGNLIQSYLNQNPKASTDDPWIQAVADEIAYYLADYNEAYNEYTDCINSYIVDTYPTDTYQGGFVSTHDDETGSTCDCTEWLVFQGPTMIDHYWECNCWYET